MTFPKASAGGTVAGFSKNAQTRIIQVTVLTYVGLCSIAMLLLAPAQAAGALIGAAATFVWYHRMALKNFGGINGDLAGCFLTVCELMMPLGAAAVTLLMQI